jgi:hypothetical protein
MAAHTVIQIANAFLSVLRLNPLGRVFVATVAGVGFVIVLRMAGDALYVVVTIQHKRFLVVKGCRPPCRLRVAL